jgi:hypothetical protein
MSVLPITDLSRLCLHTITTKPWPLAVAAKNYAAAGIRGFTVWRDAAQCHPDGIKVAGHLCRGEGLEIKVQWELFLRHVALDEPFRWSLLDGAKGVQLTEIGIKSWEERRWLEVPTL